MPHRPFVPMTLRLIFAALAHCNRKGEAAERCKKSSEKCVTTAMKLAMVAIRHQQSTSGNSFIRLYSTRAGALDPNGYKSRGC